MKLFGTLCAFAMFAGFAIGEEKKFDAASLVGTWKATAGMKAGEKMDAKMLEGEIIITKDTITIKGSDMTHVMSYKVDATKSPIVIDMVGKEGPAKDIKGEGVIGLTGDELTLVYVPQIPGNELKRPGELKSTKENKALMIVMKKSK